MKIKILYILIIFTCFNLPAQNKLADSLIEVASKTTDKAIRVTLFNGISNAYKTSSGEQVISYAEKALQLAQELENKSEAGSAYINLGNGNIIIGNYDEAVAKFLKAKSIFETLLKENPSEEIKKSLARAYGSIGIVSSEQSNYSRAFQYYIKSIAIYEALQDVNMLSRLYNNVGVAYKSQSEFEKALDYFEKAKIIQEQLKDPNIGITITNIANCYLKLKEYPKALSFYKEAENKVQQNPRALGEWHNSIGLYYKVNNNNAKAIEHWNQAIVAFNSINDKFGIADTYIYKSELLLEQKQYIKAIENATKALNLAEETKVLEQITRSEKVLSLAYEKQNNLTEALKHHKLFSKYQDSLSNVESIRKGVQAEMNFEYEKEKNRERLEQEKQQLLQAEANKTRNIKYGFIAFSLLLLGGLGFMFNNRKQLKKRLTLEKELAEYEQKALHLQMNPHFIFNCLGAISGFIINNGTDHAIKYLSKFSKLMRLTLEYSQESLIPIGKEIESLQNYLELEQLRFNNAFRFSINKDETIEDAIAIPPLLIQPIVENAIIHGIVPKKNNGTIQVTFSLLDEQLVCTIVDNGIGIEDSMKIKKECVQIHKSMALDIINKRLEMITEVSNKKATIKSFQIIDASGNSAGTKVIISLPIQYID